MSANPIDENSTPKPTGSLEELFRHHLGEEAAVPPRPMLWDQIDNSLLLRQNETYRRRLTATRWVAAASLLLATLAGAGWWARRDASFGPGSVATTTLTAGNGQAVVSGGAAQNEQPLMGTPAQKSQAASASVATLSSKQRHLAAGSSSEAGAADADMLADNTYPAAHQAAADRLLAATTSGRPSAFGPSSVHSHSAANTLAARSTVPTNAASAARVTEEGTPTLAMSNVPSSALSTGEATHKAPTAGEGHGLSSNETVAAVSNSSAPSIAGTASLTPASAVWAAAPEQVGLMAARPATLAINDFPTSPTGLATLPPPAVEPVTVPKWHYGVSYTAGIFNPNVNFSRAGIAPEYDYNPALGANSPALTEAAAAQYRQNLRPGFSQRIALLATRHLSGRWSLSTGAEISQATAKSASSLYFVGEQVNDIGQQAAGPLLPTEFRYRMAGIPVELRYANPIKRGWSLYGRLGGVVTALLGVRGQAAGDPEATRTYSITSAGTPYRRVLGTARGAVGVQFRPTAGSWTLTAGPTAEVGMASLNAHPAQDFLHESRAYGLGLEMGVEFGK